MLDRMCAGLKLRTSGNEAVHRHLTQAFEEIVEMDEALSGLKGLMARLNAFDATLVDEPDYDVRLAAFAEVNEACTAFDLYLVYV